MAKKSDPTYQSTCGYFTEDGVFHGGFPLRYRKKDKSFYIVLDGRRVDVAMVNAYGTVMILTPEVKGVACMKHRRGLR